MMAAVIPVLELSRSWEAGQREGTMQREEIQNHLGTLLSHPDVPITQCVMTLQREFQFWVEY
jgi:hypothetical protein